MTEPFDADMYDDNMAVPDESASATATAGATDATGEVAMQDAEPGLALCLPRPEALYVLGVDELSTRDLLEWLAFFYSGFPPKVEWVNDSSLNLVLKTPELATKLLETIVEGDLSVITTTNAVYTKTNPEMPAVKLTVRLCTTMDAKPRNAAQQSRYYLLHPEDERRNGRNRESRFGRGRAAAPYDKDRSRRGQAPRRRDSLEDDRPDLLEVGKDNLLYGRRKKDLSAFGGDVVAARIAEAEQAARRRPEVVRRAERGRATVPAADLRDGLRAEVKKAEVPKPALTLAERLGEGNGRADKGGDRRGKERGERDEEDLLTGLRRVQRQQLPDKEKDLLEGRVKPRSMTIKGAGNV